MVRKEEDARCLDNEAHRSTYSCDFSLNYKPGQTWRKVYREQKREAASRFAEREHGRIARVLGGRDCLITERHSLSQKAAIIDQFEQDIRCLQQSPEQQLDEEHQNRESCSAQAQEHHEACGTMLPEKYRTPIKQCIDQKIPWAQKIQKFQEENYRLAKEEFEYRFGNGKPPAGLPEGKKDPLLCESDPLQVVECTVPPRDPLQPVPILLRSANWRGGHCPVSRSQFQPITSLRPKFDFCTPSVPVDSYRPLNQKIPKNWAELYPEPIGSYGTVINSTLPDRRVAVMRQKPCGMCTTVGHILPSGH